MIRPIATRVKTLIGELHRRSPILSITGWLHVLLLVVMLLLVPIDPRTVTGLNPWIKPIKFAASIAVYLWTVAWYLDYLRGPNWARQVLSWGVSSAMLIEMLCIAEQAARGTTSHYNVTTAFDFFVFATMATMIFVNTLLMMLTLALFVRAELPQPRTYLWGIRLGILLFIVGSLEGMSMILRGAHTVGVPDGGPGLPFVNWSTKAGDLRVAHFLGLHSLQIVPLFGYLIGRKTARRSGFRPVAYVLLFAAFYWALVAYLYWQAMDARPLVVLWTVM